ncbi:MAG: hypothetical protein SFU84_06875 [Gemmatimonadales bacterium]|nr:hypothetical protein [Gemmatimonadales bacterium]
MLPLSLVNGHLIAELPEGRAVVDTGSPVTLTAPKNLTELIGTPVDLILGNDRLSRRPVLLDVEAGVIDFDARIPNGVPVRLREYAGLITATIETPTGFAEAVVDSGAPLSYADERATAEHVPVRVQEDFLLGFGTYSTPVWRVPIHFDGRLKELEVGVLPPRARAAVELVGLPTWIIGTWVFTEGPVVLDLQGDRLYRSRARTRSGYAGGPRRPVVGK